MTEFESAGQVRELGFEERPSDVERTIQTSDRAVKRDIVPVRWEKK